MFGKLISYFSFFLILTGCVNDPLGDGSIGPSIAYKIVNNTDVTVRVVSLPTNRSCACYLSPNDSYITLASHQRYIVGIPSEDIDFLEVYVDHIVLKMQLIKPLDNDRWAKSKSNKNTLYTFTIRSTDID